MAKRSKKFQKPQDKLEGYVVIAFAENMEQAREYKALLDANDIPTIINEHEAHSLGSREIAVMVSEEFLDEAHVIIESQHTYDDFYDLASEDESDADFDGDFFDDDF